MNPDNHIFLDTKLLNATLLTMCNPILMETILKVLREQIKEDDEMRTAGEIVGSVHDPWWWSCRHSGMVKMQLTRLGNVELCRPESAGRLAC